MELLIQLLTEFGADEALIALCRRIGDTAEPLTDDELTLVEVGLLELADDDEASAALLGEAADAVVAVRGEVQARQEASEAEEAERQAAIARLRGDEPAAETAPEDAPADSAENGDGEGVEGEPVEGEQAADELEPVAAAATPRARRTVPRPASSFPRGSDDDGDRDVNRITLQTAVNGFRQGQDLSLNEVGAAVAEYARRNDLRGNGEKVAIGQLQADYHPDRVMTRDGDHNTRIIDQAIRNLRTLGANGTRGLQALTAAGGYCGPRTPYYGIMVLGDAGRPVRDALVSFQARNGLAFLPPPALAALDDSVGVWTLADDVAALTDPDVIKNKLVVVCPELATVDLHAVTSQLEVGNFLARNNPELVAGFVELGMVAHARVAENELLTAIKAAATKPNAMDATVSFVRDFLGNLERAATGTRNRHRLDMDYPLHAIIPDWVEGALREDIAYGLPGGNPEANLAIADATIRGFFDARQINVSYSRDFTGQILGAQAGSAALVEYPATVEYALYPEGSLLFLDQGTLDIGPIRDSATVARNAYLQFMESFEAVAKIGPEVLWLTQDVCISGGSIGGGDALVCSGS